MSATVLSVIPTDPLWQPEAVAAERCARVLRELAPAAEDLKIRWHDRISVVHPGEHLLRIGCPKCEKAIEVAWFDGVVEASVGQFDDLDVVVPCCGAVAPLDELWYEWPVGFARFELSVQNPGRAIPWLDSVEIAALTAALGHDVRQVMARF